MSATFKNTALLVAVTLSLFAHAGALLWVNELSTAGIRHKQEPVQQRTVKIQLEAAPVIEKKVTKITAEEKPVDKAPIRQEIKPTPEKPRRVVKAKPAKKKPPKKPQQKPIKPFSKPVLAKKISKSEQKTEVKSVASKPQENTQKTNIERIKYDYIEQLLTLIRENRHYPLRSRRKGEEGLVLLGFTVQQDGQFSDIRILQTSGFKRLDKAASSILNKINGFARLPEGLKLAELKLEVPVEYRLK